MARGKREIRLNYSHHLVITFAGDDEQCDDRAALDRRSRSSGRGGTAEGDFYVILNSIPFYH